MKGTNHIVWDDITVEITKNWNQLVLVQDEQVLARTSLQYCRRITHELDKKPEISHNVISFLNVKFKLDLDILGVLYRTNLIMEANRDITKNNLVQKK